MNNTTDNVKTRYKYTNDIVAITTVLSFNIFVIYSLIIGINLPVAIITTFVLIQLAGAGWVFGKDLMDSYKK